MDFQIVKNPMSILEVQMHRGEMITAEAGALVFMKGNVEIKTRTRGGFLKGLKMKAMGGESFYVNNYVANDESCTIGLTGPPIGDIVHLQVNPGNGYILQSGSYLASSSDVELDTQWQGFKKGIFGSDLHMLKATGTGDVFANAYGGIINKQLDTGEKMILDNYHIVALSENANYNVRKLGGFKTTLLGGEGLVTEITGPGFVYFQTKNLADLKSLVAPKGK